MPHKMIKQTKLRRSRSYFQYDFASSSPTPVTFAFNALGQQPVRVPVSINDRLRALEFKPGLSTSSSIQSPCPELVRSNSCSTQLKLVVVMAAGRGFPGARVLVLGLLLSYLCVQATADSTITNLSTKGKVYVFDKLLANGKTVTIPTAKLGKVKVARELNGAFGELVLKDRRKYLVVNNGDTSFPSDLVEAKFVTNAF